MSAPLPDPSDLIAADLVPLPRAAALLLWTSAYLRGDIGPDDAVEVSLGAGHRERTVPGVDLFDWMTELRRLPLVGARLVLPRPGRIAGLIGPPAAIGSALLAGQGIVVTAAGLAEHTLVPETEDLGTDAVRRVQVRWSRFPGDSSSVPPYPNSHGAREELVHALRRAAEGSASPGIVPEEPIPSASLPPDWTGTAMPRHVPAPTQHLLQLAARTLLLSESELEDGGRARTSLAEESVREQVLRDLAEASRAALVDQVTGLVAEELG